MHQVLSFVQLALAILMAASILTQQRGASLGSAFGGESSVYRSRRGVEKWLFYTSIILSTLFIVVTILLLII